MKEPRSGLERYLPVVYMTTAIVLIALLLPTALRPPQAPPPTSAEFSPDAPPDDEQEVLLTTLSQGRSRTAGQGVAGAGPEELEVVRKGAAPARKGRCWGKPPRQTDSSYAPPCAGAWSGNNGGGSWRGVTPTEIRVGILGEAEDVGPVPTRATPNETSTLRTLRVYQQYFNERFELYGRQLRLFVVSDDAESSGSDRAAVQKADEEYKVFALIHDGGEAEDEAIRRKIVALGGGNQAPERFTESAPYMWAWLPPADMLRRHVSELVCRQLAHRPVKWTGDAGMRGRERKYGIIAYNDLTHYGAIEFISAELAKCGLTVAAGVKMNIGDQSGEIATAMAKMQTAGVTTIILANDGISTGPMTQAATKQAYFPEWVHEGSGGNDSNLLAKSYDPQQWNWSIGITALEMPAPAWQRDHYRAYKDIDPDNEPDGGDFYDMLQLIGGVQQAGPSLTPFTFQEGMFRRWPRRPAEHVWAVAGGYQAGDWSFPDYIAFIWWDPQGDDPLRDLPGAYRYVFGGKRFTFGEQPDSAPWHDKNGTVVWSSRDGETNSW